MKPIPYEDIAEESNWPEHLRVWHRHSIKLYAFIKSLSKKDWQKNLISNYFKVGKEDGKLVSLNENGEVVLKDQGALFVIAMECFNRGIDYIRDEFENVDSSREILAGMIEPNRKKLIEFFKERVEQTERDLRDRPVAPVKYTDRYFRDVDKYIRNGYKQSKALDAVCKAYDLNREGFEKQYRIRWLDRKIKPKS